MGDPKKTYFEINREPERKPPQKNTGIAAAGPDFINSRAMPMAYKVYDLNEKFIINKESLDQPKRYDKSKSAGKLNTVNKRGISEVGLNYRERHRGA